MGSTVGHQHRLSDHARAEHGRGSIVVRRGRRAPLTTGAGRRGAVMTSVGAHRSRCAGGVVVAARGRPGGPAGRRSPKWGRAWTGRAHRVEPPVVEVTGH
ncbi:hypothetical protein DMP15_20495 [Pseudonocardia sp. UM4_GMWB1]